MAARRLRPSGARGAATRRARRLDAAACAQSLELLEVEPALPSFMRLDNPATGEIIEVLSESPELLVMRATWTRNGHRAVAHVHPGMQERWEVLEGRAAFNIDGHVSRLGPGGSAVAEPGQRHLAWNPSDDTVVLRIEMRPALRWSQFVRRLFAGESVMPLLAEFPEEIRIG